MRRFILSVISCLGAATEVHASSEFQTVDLSALSSPDSFIALEAECGPVWIIYRTEAMVQLMEELEFLSKDPDSEVGNTQPPYIEKAHRAIKKKYFVVKAICPASGRLPAYRRKFGSDTVDGFYFPEGSLYDYAGRVLKDSKGEKNMWIPPHRYIWETLLEVDTGWAPDNIVHSTNCHDVAAGE